MKYMLFLSISLVFLFTQEDAGIVENVKAKEDVKVGIYQNAPKIFIDSSGKPSGFFVDILDEIALRENLNINYVSCEWSECIKQLEDDQIDILPDVAYTKYRDKKFVFTQEPVLSSWSVIYKHKNARIDSVLNLQDKKIAVLKDSIQYDAIKMVLHAYGIKALEYKEVLNYSEAFKLLSNHDVDSVVINRFYELNHELGPNVVKTDIILKPSMLKYAFSTKKKDLADRINHHLVELKKDKNSIFYEAKKKWLTPKASTKTPKWLIYVVGVGIFVILTLAISVVIFQRLVTKKTKELLQKEELILLQSKQAAMGEMISLIVHQWRQPLSIISMSANNIELSASLGEKISEEKLCQSMKTISNQTQYLSSTMNDFKNFFKPGKTAEEVDVLEVINKVDSMLAGSLKNNNIVLELKSIDNYKIKTFQSELIQVIINIINNAKDVLKQTKPTNPKITISTTHTTKSLKIIISDNGGGIPKDVINKIGKQYFTTKGNNGTGLGLYMSIIIVKEHLGGSLKWENVDDGARFTIIIKKS